MQELLYSYAIDYGVLFILLLSTLIVLFVALRYVKDTRFRILITLMLSGVFVYSGYGISYLEVNDRYVSKYIIFIIFLVLPFLVFAKKKIYNTRNSRIDNFIFANPHFLKNCAYIYLILCFIPLVYPDFKIIDVFRKPAFNMLNLWEERWDYWDNPIIRMVDAFKIFFQPFFMIYLTVVQMKDEKKGRLAVWLFVLLVFMMYARYGYLSRYQMLIYGMLIFLLAVVVKGDIILLKRKHILWIAGTLVASIPFLYLFTFYRTGNDYGASISFVDILQQLINSETYYPIHYDTILSSSLLIDQTPMTFILWILFLPIPSFLWPGKPTLQADAFTYAVTGKSFGDSNFANSLPSVLGESFMYFGDHFYWLQALIIGLSIVFIMRFLMKSRTLTFYTIYLIVFVLTLGRGGAASYMSTIINGSLSIFILGIFLQTNKNR